MKKLILLVLPFLASCGLSMDLVEEAIAAPDYTDLGYWVAHPEKVDLSDSVYSSRPSDQFNIPVFFVSPTVHFPKKGGNWNVDPSTDEGKNAFNTPVQYQSTAFNVAGPIYSPAYRQSAYQVYNVAPNATTVKSYAIAYEDVKSAFMIFLKQIGPKTPFILASHSQGTDHLIQHIQREFTPLLEERLVAAYLVGMPVNDCDIRIPICEEPKSTGCYTSWRTYHISAKYYNKYPVECIGVVNPLSWTTVPTRVPASMNKDVLVSDEKPLFQELVSAKISNGVVVTERPQFPGSFVIRTKNYHRGDINLYYGNIQENVIARCVQYLKEQGRPE